VAGPLDGVRVLELGHVMAGPVCGLMLGDMGADVVKIERLPGGDGTRGFVPPEIGGESAAFMMLNRGKRGVALDLRDPRGVDVVRRLARRADVLIENFRVGTMERMGIGWESLHQENPRLVYCQITGFGRTGPLAERGGFDLIAQGYSGLMSITGEAAGRTPVMPTKPMKIGAPVTDITAGILAAFGAAAALFERERTGEGRRVDTSLYEAAIAQTYWQSAIALASGVSPGPLGSAHPLSAPYQAFRTADGWINVGASNESTWARLTDAVGRPGLRRDPRFASNAERMRHVTELLDALEPIFAERTTERWLAELERAGVPAGPVASIGEMLEHPQTIAREMVIEVEHSQLGPVRALGAPVKTTSPREAARESTTHRRGAPVLGEHTREVLREAALTDTEIEGLERAGVALTAG
jgi:crotonobetainyl-CoA:carnitine CoA-transferase CaiB-like acyl-CoA transferase